MKKLVIASIALLLLGTGSLFAQPKIPAVDSKVYRLTQSDSFQVQQLEEEVRRLNGKVEEMNFLLLQLQEKLRKMEEDNEGRFQEIEEKQSDAGGSAGEKTEDVAEAPKTGGADRLGKPEPSETPAPSDENQEPTETATATVTPPTAPKKPRDLTPRALGTLTFDSNGNVIDARPEDEQLAGLPDSTSQDEALNASEFGATPNEVLSVGKKSIDSRDYETARRALSAHRAAWPKDPSAGQVLHYLGEAQFWQKNYFEAANAHLEAHKNYPEAPTAADNLLGLGLSLAGLNQREVACATYAEVIKQYPESEPRLGERLKDEQASAKC